MPAKARDELVATGTEMNIEFPETGMPGEPPLPGMAPHHTEAEIGITTSGA